MQEIDKAYAAGFFDGEGTIFVSRQSRGMMLAASVSQNDRQPLDWLQALFGGTVRIKHQTKRDIHEWRINGYACIRFFEAVSPYLMVKHADVSNATARWEARDNKRLTAADLDKLEDQ